jgi:hypothetical protein
MGDVTSGGRLDGGLSVRPALPLSVLSAAPLPTGLLRCLVRMTPSERFAVLRLFLKPENLCAASCSALMLFCERLYRILHNLADWLAALVSSPLRVVMVRVAALAAHRRHPHAPAPVPGAAI